MKKQMVDIEPLGNLKEWRVSQGLKQVDVALKCGISVQTYQRWEYGLSKYAFVDNYNRLADMMGKPKV